MFKPRLRRLDWVFTASPVYFLTTCTARHRPLLSSKSVHHTFLAFTQNAIERGVLVRRYVLMPDHLHLFAAFGPDSPRLSEWMKALKRTLAKDLARHGVEPPIWQKTFFDHVLRSAESYERKWTYVLWNPVRAGLVKDPSDWPYQGEVFPLTVESRLRR